MKTILKIIIALITAAVAPGCVNIGPKYVKRDGKVFHRDWKGGGSWSKSETELVGVDRRSFKAMEVPGNFLTGEIFGRDRNRVYWRHLEIAGADPETFKPLSEVFSVDGNHVYLCNEVFPNGDPHSFRIPYDRYALDADSVYFIYRPYYWDDSKMLEQMRPYNVAAIAGADPETFEMLGHYYAKDKNAVYDSGEVLSEISDPATFKLLGGPEREMKTVVNFIDEVQRDSDSWHEWGCDKDYYYRNGLRIEGADRESFAFFDEDGGGRYAKDRDHVFFCDRPRPFLVEGADVETFEVLNKYRDFARDKNGYYLEGKPISYEEVMEEGLIKTEEQKRRDRESGKQWLLW